MKDLPFWGSLVVSHVWVATLWAHPGAFPAVMTGLMLGVMLLHLYARFRDGE